MIGSGTIYTNDKLPTVIIPDMQRSCRRNPNEHTLTTLVREGSEYRSGQHVGNNLKGRFELVGMGSTHDSVPIFISPIGQPPKSLAASAAVGHCSLGSQSKQHNHSFLLTCQP
jgi:hypothetical protein